MPAGTRTLVADADRFFGRSWVIARVMAHAPAVLAAMLALWERLGASSLSDMDREVIALEIAVTNGCHYCVPAHRYAAHQRGLDDAPLEAIARGETLTLGRPAVVQALVRRLVATRGALSDEEFQAFQDRGITPSQMI
jgi:AhpD family alkylhydroperoxidase